VLAVDGVSFSIGEARRLAWSAIRLRKIHRRPRHLRLIEPTDGTSASPVRTSPP